MAKHQKKSQPDGKGNLTSLCDRRQGVSVFMEICVWQYWAVLMSAVNGTSGGRDLSKEQTGNDGYTAQGSCCTVLAR